MMMSLSVHSKNSSVLTLNEDDTAYDCEYDQQHYKCTAHPFSGVLSELLCTFQLLCAPMYMLNSSTYLQGRCFGQALRREARRICAGTSGPAK